MEKKNSGEKSRESIAMTQVPAPWEVPITLGKPFTRVPYARLHSLRKGYRNWFPRLPALYHGNPATQHPKLGVHGWGDGASRVTFLAMIPTLRCRQHHGPVVRHVKLAAIS